MYLILIVYRATIQIKLVNPNYRQPPNKELLEMLKKHGADLEKPIGGTAVAAMTPILPYVSVIQKDAFINRVFKNQIAANEGRGAAKTALHLSAERGNTTTAAALVHLIDNLPALEKLRDEDGLTPVERLKITHPGTAAPEIIAKVLRADQEAAGSRGAATATTKKNKKSSCAWLLCGKKGARVEPEQ
jgi:hypothetical protein